MRKKILTKINPVHPQILEYMSTLMSSLLLDINYFCFFPMRQRLVFEMMFLFPVLVILI